MRIGLKAHFFSMLFVLLSLASALTLFVSTIFWAREAAVSFAREKELALHLIAEYQFYRFLTVGYESEYARALLQEALHKHGAAMGCVQQQWPSAFCMGDDSGGGHDQLQRMLRAIDSDTVLRQFRGRQWFGFVSGKQFVDLALQVKGPDQIIYPVALRFPLISTYFRIWSLQRYIAVYLLFNVFVLVVIGFFRIRYFFLKPLERLLQLTQSYQEKRGVPFLALHESNELEQLQTSLQQMLERIRADQEKLEEHVLSLEEANAHLKNTQNEMIRAEKLSSVGRLAAGMAHEIGNPVGIVQGYIGLLSQHECSLEDREDFCERAEQELSRVSTLIRQLLDFARPATGTDVLLDPYLIIHDALALLRPQPLFDSIEIVENLCMLSGQILGNPDQLTQVLLNCLMNAADAIHSRETANGSIVIESSLQQRVGGGIFTLTIADNGIGLTPENLEAAFDPFFTTKAPGSGTGLGLSVSYALIQQMKGSLHIANRAEGGAIVTISLPVHAM